MRRALIGVLACALLAITAFGFATAGEHATPAATPASYSDAVTREVINAGMPEAAPGQVLELVRYTIEPNTKLPIHTHPGIQVAYVESGILHFSVLEGTAEVSRATDGDYSGPIEVLGPGMETVFEPGDRFVETDGLVHFGENRSDEPVVLLVASLFLDGKPPSTEIEGGTPPAE